MSNEELKLEFINNLKDQILVLDVTKEDILKGKRHSCNACPVYRAFARMLKTNQVEVGHSVIWIRTGSVEFCVKIPAEIGKWIKRFDAGGSRSRYKPWSMKLLFRTEAPGYVGQRLNFVNI